MRFALTFAFALALAAGFAVGPADACGWGAKTAETDKPVSTVMLPQTPAPTPKTGG